MSTIIHDLESVQQRYAEDEAFRELVIDLAEGYELLGLTVDDARQAVVYLQELEHARNAQAVRSGGGGQADSEASG